VQLLLGGERHRPSPGEQPQLLLGGRRGRLLPDLQVGHELLEVCPRPQRLEIRVRFQVRHVLEAPGRGDGPAAVTATAHKLARIVYLALKLGMTYVRQSQDEYEAQMKEKQIKALRRKARQLELEVIAKPPASGATAAATPVQG
jgi:hypothetical protein